MKFEKQTIVQILIFFLSLWILNLGYADRYILADFASRSISKVLGISVVKIMPTPTITPTDTPPVEMVNCLLPDGSNTYIAKIACDAVKTPSTIQPQVSQPITYQQKLPKSNDNTSANAINDNNTYQNYGWYIHNGVSMQYVNGNWYSTPQQDNKFLPQFNSNNNPSNINTSQTIQPQQSSPQDIYVNCQTVGGVYLLSQAECDQAHARDQAGQASNE